MLPASAADVAQRLGNHFIHQLHGLRQAYLSALNACDSEQVLHQID